MVGAVETVPVGEGGIGRLFDPAMVRSCRAGPQHGHKGNTVASAAKDTEVVGLGLGQAASLLLPALVASSCEVGCMQIHVLVLISSP